MLIYCLRFSELFLLDIDRSIDQDNALNKNVPQIITIKKEGKIIFVHCRG